MHGLLAHLEKERSESQAAHEAVRSELDEQMQLMEKELYDIEIVFKLKQGQVEVPQAAVVTDYSDAIVIDNEVVEARNRRIQELGQEKVGILETTKEFRKQLNFIQWEHRMLAMQTTDLEERTKDVHMLRVTKELQSLLKGGEEGKNKADADLLERKIEHLKATIESKETTLKKQYGMVAHATKLRKSENAMLEKKLRELQQNVIQREHIRRLRAPQGGGAGGATGTEGGKKRIVGGGGRSGGGGADLRPGEQVAEGQPPERVLAAPATVLTRRWPLIQHFPTSLDHVVLVGHELVGQSGIDASSHGFLCSLSGPIRRG